MNDDIEAPLPTFKEDNILVAFQMISPELAKWFLSLSIYDRELIILDAYTNEVFNKIEGGTKMKPEEYIFAMHNQPGITIIIESPPVQGESDIIKDAVAEGILSEIVKNPNDWYLTDVFLKEK